MNWLTLTQLLLQMAPAELALVKSIVDAMHGSHPAPISTITVPPLTPQS